MMQAGETVVYKCRGLYEIQEVGPLNFRGADRKKMYYTMQSVSDKKEKVYVPVEGDHGLRKPANKEEVLELIDSMDAIELLWIQNERMREREYKACISSCKCEEWVKILKTLHNRTNRRGMITSMDKVDKFIRDRKKCHILP
ncbi:MAG: CarD family transcriptional regulator [Blautia sp.]